ncbi:MAG: hypothetical protein NXY57DRAFT_514286 [Lentinula lateritia]|uniref:Uncharacterized protein n=1 Tax=Lentinula lateritia TaxID=40482 RepID=A0ABQ8UZI8_9AGAR|nr:hypothetical protein F5051DRAFT_377754 [Lentinula edodes]KAJ3889103.1 hypothetical protein GG344DRAFT_52325 [Lentinula edodes]KAJ3928481.1 MAG: hypothetical protein NXY57DRAFT_514286 [Lentinula lateritia]KAJ4467094.1 hypothetical protein C8R41DRAFT_925873 [Lentinula lateritia]
MVSAENTMVVPLSGIDQNGVHTSSITFGYVVARLDVEALEAAAIRAAEEWRLLAGRVEWNATIKSFQVRVPVSGSLPKDYALVKFTTSKLPSTKLPITPFDDSSATFLERPPVKLFRHSSTLNSLSDYASKKAPILSLHVSLMANCACVGMTLPHGIFDATGMGQVVQALNSCLNNLPWTPPKISSSSILAEELKRLRESESVGDPCPPGLVNLQRDFTSVNVKNVLTLGASCATELLWHRVKPAAIYLGSNVVQEMVANVKKQAADEGKGWVSTGDILVAFLLKAAYLDEGPTSPNALTMSAAVSLRSVLAATNRDFESYTHNALLPLALPPLTVQQVSSMSLYEFALIHRKAIEDMRNIPYIQGYEKWVPSIGGAAIPARRKGTDSWLLSNQVVGGVDKLDLGSEPLGFWHWMLPFMPDHVFTVNKLRGGYILDGFSGVRPQRLKAIEKALEGIRRGEPLVV